MRKPFASTSAADEREQKEQEARRFTELRESLTRLVANEDFRAWFRYIDWHLYGETIPTVELDAFTQGKRSVMGLLKRSIAIADGGPEFLGLIAQRHFTAIAEARAKARLNNEDGE